MNGNKKSVIIVLYRSPLIVPSVTKGFETLPLESMACQTRKFFANFVLHLNRASLGASLLIWPYRYLYLGCLLGQQGRKFRRQSPESFLPTIAHKFSLILFCSGLSGRWHNEVLFVAHMIWFLIFFLFCEHFHDWDQFFHQLVDQSTKDL